MPIFISWVGQEGKKETFFDLHWTISNCTSQEPAMVGAEFTKYFNSYYYFENYEILTNELQTISGQDSI